MFSAKPETPAKNQNQLPPTIDAAMAGLKEATGAVRRIQELIAAAREDRQKASREHEAAFGELAASEAAVLLDGAAAVAKSMRAAVDKHQQNLLALDARIAGLVNRQQGAAKEVDLASRELSSRLDEWAGSEKARARKEFQSALMVFLETIEGPVATGIALGDVTFGTIARGGVIPSFEGAENAFNRIRFYHSNQEMGAVIGAYSGVRQACRAAIDSATELVMQMKPRAQHAA